MLGSAGLLAVAMVGIRKVQEALIGGLPICEYCQRMLPMPELQVPVLAIPNTLSGGLLPLEGFGWWWYHNGCAVKVAEATWGSSSPWWMEDWPGLWRLLGTQVVSVCE